MNRRIFIVPDRQIHFLHRKLAGEERELYSRSLVWQVEKMREAKARLETVLTFMITFEID